MACEWDFSWTGRDENRTKCRVHVSLFTGLALLSFGQPPGKQRLQTPSKASGDPVQENAKPIRPYDMPCDGVLM